MRSAPPWVTEPMCCRCGARARVFLFQAELRARMSMPATGTEALQEEADRAVISPPVQDPGEVGEQ